MIKAVRVDKVKKIWSGETKTGYESWIKARKPIQWGGLSDPFCPIEESFGVGLELMKFFNEIKQPISFSSKSDLVLRDERYLNEFKKAGNLWHYKSSIITLDDAKSRLLEDKTPTPQQRIKTLQKLAEVGTLTTWRLRPFIVGVTDKNLEEIFQIAKQIGVQSITTEFFCIEIRGLGRNATLDNYKKISQAMGTNVIKFYQKYGKGSGYLRLSYDFIRPYVRQYLNLGKKYGISCFISDAMHKEKSCGGSCCGLLDDNEHFKNYAKLQFTSLLQVIKKKGVLSLRDAINLTPKEELEWRNNTHIGEFMNMGSCSKRSKTKNMSYQDYFIKRWNSAYFEKYFNGLIKRWKKDDKGDWIYTFNYSQSKI
jgi:DNA repair photolyase